MEAAPSGVPCAPGPERRGAPQPPGPCTPPPHGGAAPGSPWPGPPQVAGPGTLLDTRFLGGGRRPRRRSAARLRGGGSSTSLGSSSSPSSRGGGGGGMGRAARPLLLVAAAHDTPLARSGTSPPSTSGRRAWHRPPLPIGRCCPLGTALHLSLVSAGGRAPRRRQASNTLRESASGARATAGRGGLWEGFALGLV